MGLRTEVEWLSGVRAGLSDEVETFDVLSKVVVGNWHSCLGWALSPISDQISQSVGVLNRSRHLDGASHVVVGVAQLVSQRLNLGWVSPGGVVHDHIVGWAHHSLAGDLTN